MASAVAISGSFSRIRSDSFDPGAVLRSAGRRRAWQRLAARRATPTAGKSGRTRRQRGVVVVPQAAVPAGFGRQAFEAGNQLQRRPLRRARPTALATGSSSASRRRRSGPGCRRRSPCHRTAACVSFSSAIGGLVVERRRLAGEGEPAVGLLAAEDVGLAQLDGRSRFLDVLAPADCPRSCGQRFERRSASPKCSCRS